MTTTPCESCGMPMSSEADHAPGHRDSRWCAHGSNPDGTSQPFEERFQRSTQWAVRHEGLSGADAEARTREYMRSMPLWRDHPALQ